MKNLTLHFAHKNQKRDFTPDHDQLYQIAETQAGYFTAAQGRLAGFSRTLLSYHMRSGLFERIYPGLYRLRRFPASPHEDLFVACLRVGARAVVSHDSALALYELSDLLPSAIHLIVPRTASRRHPGLCLHTNRLEPHEVTQYAGLPITTVARTIVDVASSDLGEELVWQAITEAIQRGLTTPEQLSAATKGRHGRASKLVVKSLTHFSAVRTGKTEQPAGTVT